jgi:pyruvate/2-oxoglutarate dehydrogenase complex dihydrolipoamide acyltransferase (E2) component
MKHSFDPNNNWRRMAISIYRKPLDAKILGSVEIDVTRLEEYVVEKRQQGLKVTLMHPIILMTARALREEVPELNCYVCRGRLIHRDTVDVTVSVLMRDSQQMSAILVPNADKMSLQELVDFMDQHVQDTRKGGTQNKTMRGKNFFASLPWPFRDWLINMVKRISIDWGFRIPALGVNPSSFGSFIMSNIGSLGLDIGYPALLPLSNVSFVLVMGSVNTKPAIFDDQIVPRRLLTLSATLDHRVVDGSHGGKLFRYLKKAVLKPELLDRRVEAG